MDGALNEEKMLKGLKYRPCVQREGWSPLPRGRVGWGGVGWLGWVLAPDGALPGCHVAESVRKSEMSEGASIFTSRAGERTEPFCKVLL